jgi:hypothetical protein
MALCAGVRGACLGASACVRVGRRASLAGGARR